MDFIEALETRHSVRQFRDQSVPQSVLDELFETALKSPSSSNTQSYKVAVASGDLCRQIREDLSNKFTTANEIQKLPLPLKIVRGITSGVMPDGDYNPNISYPPELKKRAFACGMGLYGTLGIAREDKAGRTAQMLRNFEFFDAPTALFFFVHKDMGMYGAVDLGIFMQTLMLAATDRGLGTCAQGALGLWGGPVRKYFDIEKDYKLVCGMSLGYPDTDHVVNGYWPDKKPLSELLAPVKQGAPSSEPGDLEANPV